MQRWLQWHLGATQPICPEPPLIPTEIPIIVPWGHPCLHTLLWDGASSQAAVAPVNTNRLGPWKQPKRALTLWHSCLVEKKNRAGKANTEGSLGSSILLPLIFLEVLNSIVRKQIEAETQPLNARLYLHFTWHGVLGPCDSGQEISSSESQLPTQKRRQSFLLHCTAAKEKLIKDCFSFRTTSSKCWWEETIMKDLYQFLKI